jgi:hypothetical protein
VKLLTEHAKHVNLSIVPDKRDKLLLCLIDASNYRMLMLFVCKEELSIRLVSLVSELGIASFVSQILWSLDPC